MSLYCRILETGSLQFDRTKHRTISDHMSVRENTQRVEIYEIDLWYSRQTLLNIIQQYRRILMVLKYNMYDVRAFSVNSNQMSFPVKYEKRKIVNTLACS